MPGNPYPLSTIDLKQRGWPDHDGTAWPPIPTTPAPKTSFDASSGHNLVGTVGYQKWNSQTDRNYNEEIPHLPGQRGIRVNYPARNAFQNNNGNEFNFELLVHQQHIFQYMKVAQPTNFKMPREAQLLPKVLTDIADWQAGDQLEAGSIGSGKTAVIETIDKDGSTGQDPLIIKDFHGHPELTWGSNKVVHNLTRGNSAEMGKAGWNENNSKFMHAWVSDEPLDQGRGYENASYALGIDPPFDHDAPDFSGNGMSKTGGVKADIGMPTENSPGGYAPNQLQGMPDVPVLFDVADNGHVVELVLELKRSTNSWDGSAVPDGVVALWRKVNRPGSPYEQWTEVLRNENRTLYSSFYDNKWTHGYLFGNKNGGYREDTTFWLMAYQLWLEKPTFLIDAGV